MKETMKSFVLGMMVMVCLMTFALLEKGQAASPTQFAWDRVNDPSVVAYKVYMCKSSPTCVPDPAKDVQFGADVPQTAVGVIPTLLLPTVSVGQTIIDSERYAVVAIDGIGMMSTDSNVLPFRAQAIPVPMNLRVQ